ncbi:MAG: aminotransferase class IV, partial [Marinilabiliaceae bacterium]
MEKGLRPKKTRLSLSMEFIGNCIIRNGSIEPADEQSHIGDDNEVYEVLRVEAGKPLFVEDHLARWRDSMKAVGVALPKWTDSFETLITWLIACHTLPNCDMRIVASADGDIQCGYVQTEYPSLQMYAEGVKAELLNAERETPRL